MKKLCFNDNHRFVMRSFTKDGKLHPRNKMVIIDYMKDNENVLDFISRIFETNFDKDKSLVDIFNVFDIWDELCEKYKNNVYINMIIPFIEANEFIMKELSNINTTENNVMIEDMIFVIIDVTPDIDELKKVIYEDEDDPYISFDSCGGMFLDGEYIGHCADMEHD